MGSRRAHSSGRRRAGPKIARLRRESASSGTMGSTRAAVVLGDVRNQLELVMAIAYVACAALRFQNVDGDEDVALALQRAVGDELGRQIEQVDRIIRQLEREATAGPSDEAA